MDSDLETRITDLKDYRKKMKNDRRSMIDTIHQVFDQIADMVEQRRT